MTVVARVTAESFDQQPAPCGPVIEIYHSSKDAIVAWLKRLFKLADLLGLSLDQADNNWMPVAE